MFEYKSFLGYGIVIPRKELKFRSPYRKDYLCEKFEKSRNLIYMERGYEMSDVFIGFLLDKKNESMTEDLRQAEKNFPQLYERVFSASMNPRTVHPKVWAKSGDVWTKD